VSVAGEALSAASVAAAAASLHLSFARWLRVAQREHYLPGATTRFALRWYRSRPVNLALGALAAAGLVEGEHPVAVLVGAAALAVAPVGLGVRGRTTPLRRTRRLVTAGVASAMLVGAGAAAAGAAAGLRGAGFALLAGAFYTPLLLDAVLWVLQPLEDALAERYVRRARGRLARVRPRIVGITGSYGKTTTKGYAAHLLSARYQVLASPQSYNNRAGLAKTVNEQLGPATEVFVAEMGAYGPGEIASLCRWLPPEVGAITAIGPVHLERFGSLERTLAAKAELAEAARVAVLNVGDGRLAGLAERLSAAGKPVVRVLAAETPAASTVAGDHPPDPPADLVVRAVGLAALEVRWREGPPARVELPELPPALANVAVALGIALAMGVELDAALPRLATLPVAPHRLEAVVGPQGVVVLDDTFNSNPAGARLALGRLAALDGPRRRVLVTPGMVELGPRQYEENVAFAAEACAVVSDLVVVGRTNRRALIEGCRRAGRAVRVVCVPRREDAVRFVRESLQPGDAVLYENDLPDHYP
jgi:UDP-N-acetylmuramoyl-tripeptide--D-alanyl-D-alanine ligase